MGSSENWAYALGEGMLGWRDDLEKLSMELELEGGEPDIEICYSGFILYRQGFGGPLMIARDACTRWAAIGGKVKRFQVSAKHSPNLEKHGHWIQSSYIIVRPRSYYLNQYASSLDSVAQSHSLCQVPVDMFILFTLDRAY